jgi:hypothetical protein
MQPSTGIFAYFGPEVVLPVASTAAAVFGFFLMIGRAPLRFAARVFRRLTGRGRQVS